MIIYAPLPVLIDRLTLFYRIQDEVISGKEGLALFYQWMPLLDS
jgi:hypothetical protein